MDLHSCGFPYGRETCSTAAAILMQQLNIKTRAAKVQFGRAEDGGTLLIEWAGASLLEERAPTFDSVALALAEEPRPTRAAYETSDLGEWDSSAI